MLDFGDVTPKKFHHPFPCLSKKCAAVGRHKENSKEVNRVAFRPSRHSLLDASEIRAVVSPVDLKGCFIHPRWWSPPEDSEASTTVSVFSGFWAIEKYVYNGGQTPPGHISDHVLVVMASLTSLKPKYFSDAYDLFEGGRLLWQQKLCPRISQLKTSRLHGQDVLFAAHLSRSPLFGFRGRICCSLLFLANSLAPLWGSLI